jgi:hypothetical protein
LYKIDQSFGSMHSTLAYECADPHPLDEANDATQKQPFLSLAIHTSTCPAKGQLGEINGDPANGVDSGHFSIGGAYSR